MIRSLSRALGLLGAIVMCLGVAGLTAPPAHAAVSLSVAVTDIEVTGTSPTSKVVLTGKVTNTGSVSAFGVQVIMWRSTEEVTDVATLDAVANSGTTPPGSRVVARESNYTRPFAGGKAFAPKATSTFTVSATLSQLGVDEANAAYAVGVDVRGNGNGSSTYQTLAKARSVVPIADDTQSASTAPLVLFTSQPSAIGPNEFDGDRLADELSSAGRLSELMDAVEDEGLSWVIDPSLLSDVVSMAAGYRANDDGHSEAGVGTDEATDWLERLGDLPTEDGYRTLFALPDVATAAQLGQTSVLDWSIDAGESVDGFEDLPLLVLPASLSADDTTVAYLADTDAAAVATSRLTTTATWVDGEVPLLRVSDPDHPTGIARPLGLETYLSAEAMVLSGQGHTQVRVISSTTDLAALDAAPPWVTTTTLATILDETPSRVTPTYSRSTGTMGLTNAEIASLSDLADRLESYSNLSPTAPAAVERTRVLSRAASSTWAGRPDERADWLAAATSDVAAASTSNAVILDATSRFVMSGKANEFPITVTNALDYPVTVSVHLTSSNPQRLDVEPSEEITVDPGESRTVNIRPVASSNGVATVTALLVTSDNTPVGQSIEITVEATQYGVIGWVLVAISGAVLIATTAWSLRKSRGRTRAEEAA